MNETTELIMKQLNSKKVHAETHELGGGDEIDALKLKNAGSLVTKSGDFAGTWNGLAMTSAEPGLSTAFNALKAETIHIDRFPIQTPEVNDTARIQRSIDYASSQGGGAVNFGAKTYIVGSTINLKSNVELHFAKGSLVKIADNCTGYYGLFSIKSVQNVSIRGLTFDGNVNRTTYDISNASFPEIPIYIVDSSNIHIEKNVFNSCGKWTISCETSSTFPNNDNIRIEKNTIIYTVGKNSKVPDIAGMTVDTTQVYVDAKNYWIQDNIITTTNTNAETAIEAHRRNGVVENNTIVGFRNGVLVVPGMFAEDNDAMKTSVQHNKMYDIRSGVTLWPMTERDLDEVIIANNSLELDPARFPNVQTSKGVLILDTLPGNNSGKKIKNVHVSDNLIKYKPFTVAFADSAYVLNFVGISMRSWVSAENIKIVDNTIINAPGTGMLIGANGDATYANTVSGIFAENNTIINAGINENIATQSYNPRCAIRLNGSTSANVEKSIMQNNKIIDNKPNGNYFTTPVYVAAYNIDTCIIANNPILAFGFGNIDTLKSFTMGWSFDSQVGSPVVTKIANYILKEKFLQLFATLEITSMAGFTGGYASYITLPIKSIETRDVPIFVLSTNYVAGVQWYLKLVANSNSAYIWGILSSNASNTTLSQSDCKVGTKISIACEYLI